MTAHRGREPSETAWPCANMVLYSLSSFTPNTINHIVNSCGLRFNDAVMLVVVVRHEIEYRSADKVDDGEV